MKRSRRLQPASDQAQREENTAAQNLGRRLEQLQYARRKLDELLAWEQEYAAQLQKGVANLGQLQSYRQFMQELTRAIEAQRLIVAEAEEGAKQARSAWQGRYARKMVVNRLVEKYQLSERKDEERREQKEMEESCLIRWTRKA